MSDLFVSAFAPTLGSGRKLRTYTTIKALARLGPVDVAYVPFEGDSPAEEYLRIENLHFHEIHPSRRVRRAMAYARAIGAGVPEEWARGCSPELVRTTEKLAAVPGRGRVVAGDPFVAAALHGMARRRSVIYNAHNVESGFPFSARRL